MTKTMECNEKLTFSKYLAEHFGYEGTQEEQEKAALERNRNIVDEYFEEEWCLSYSMAEREVMKEFQKAYIADCEKAGLKRENFWWE